MRRLALAVLFSMLVASCGGGEQSPTDTPEPTQAAAWPDEYEEWICGGLQELQLNASPKIDDLVQAARVLDVEEAADAADGIGDSASDALGMFDLAPRWGPGQKLKRLLVKSATQLGQASNLVKTGLREYDLDTAKAGAKRIKTATGTLEDATAALRSLRSKTGFSCE